MFYWIFFIFSYCNIDIKDNLEVIYQILNKDDILIVDSYINGLFIFFHEIQKVDIKFFPRNEVLSEDLEPILYDFHKPSAGYRFEKFGKVEFKAKESTKIIFSAISLSNKCENVFLSSNSQNSFHFSSFPEDLNYSISNNKQSCLFFSFYPTINFTISSSLTDLNSEIYIKEKLKTKIIKSNDFLINYLSTDCYIKFNLLSITSSEYISIYSDSEFKNNQFNYKGIVPFGFIPFIEKILPTSTDFHNKDNINLDFNQIFWISLIIFIIGFLGLVFYLIYYRRSANYVKIEIDQIN